MRVHVHEGTKGEKVEQKEQKGIEREGNRGVRRRVLTGGCNNPNYIYHARIGLLPIRLRVEFYLLLPSPSAVPSDSSDI